MASNFQRQGIGSKILNMLLRVCKEKKIRDIQLFSAKGKSNFYIKNDFVPRDLDAPGMEYLYNFNSSD